MPKKKENSKGDIFQLLLETSEKREKRKREELLELLNVKEFFEEGCISINERTCQGLECELCIKACPTKALYWQDGKVGIIKDLCVYCGACVLCCIVDDCIKITRKRSDGKVESFSRPWEVVLLFNNINSQRRHSRVKSLFPDTEAYLKRFHKVT
ncbi:MAG: hypothetical protein OEY24_04760 [Candidatus Bathyarchaeota archaeon]|nr:hypothetical protein [Candidatus Bathyarchaeota archaeon]MDH5494991.1 hypothetical protein [Candidatus Bathyarchaeota archaeon]